MKKRILEVLEKHNLNNDYKIKNFRKIDLKVCVKSILEYAGVYDYSMMHIVIDNMMPLQLIKVIDDFLELNIKYGIMYLLQNDIIEENELTEL